MLPAEVAPAGADLYCSSCARVLDYDSGFCPGCGQDTERFCRCAACGVWQFVPEELVSAHCLHCGQSLG
jgi:hypothetical protein